MKLLVSVRNAAEAALAARAGVHFVDLKEPALGALGGLPVATIAQVVAVLRREAPGTKISATIGDWPPEALAEIEAQVRAVAATGVDYVKVGIGHGTRAPRPALALLGRLGELQAQGLAIVPVFVADQGLPPGALALAAGAGFPAVMLDTQDKLSGSLMAVLPPAELAGFVQAVRAGGALAGLAGALQLADWPALRALNPDFAGFRSAVCAGDRAGALDPTRLDALLACAREAAPVPA